MAKIKTRLTFSAGGVVFRQGTEGLEIVLVKYDDVWGLPKGTPEGRETKEQTAIREVAEETGVEVEILEPIADISYWFISHGTRVHKTVYFFLMKAIGGDISHHDYEHERVEWFSLEEAYKIMTHSNEVQVVRGGTKSVEKYF
jgi:8-oxo-dGTP pyrophosphatase MutT (NUDIX family)